MLENFTGYEKKNWKNSPDKTTPLSAENLDYMDSGVKRNADALQEIKNAIADKVENRSDKIPTCKAVVKCVQEMGGGDMLTSVYDPEKTGKVISAVNADNASQFGGNQPAYYAKADMVTKKYDSNATYTKGQTCIQNDKIWRAKADINTPEAWTEGHWEETSLEQIRAEMESEISALNARTIKSIQVSFTTDSNGEAMVYNSDDIIPLFLRTNYSITNEYPKYEFFNYNGYIKVRATLFSTPVYQTLSSGISISGTFYYMEIV